MGDVHLYTSLLYTVGVFMNRLRKLVQSMGGAIEECPEGSFITYQIEAPAGYVWACSSIHCIKLEWLASDRKYRAEAIADAIERVSLGTAECGDHECDYCNPE